MDASTFSGMFADWPAVLAVLLRFIVAGAAAGLVGLGIAAGLPR